MVDIRHMRSEGRAELAEQIQGGLGVRRRRHDLGGRRFEPAIEEHRLDT